MRGKQQIWAMMVVKTNDCKQQKKDRMLTDWKKSRRMVLKKLFLVRSANDVLNNSSNNICWLIFDPPKIIFLLWRQKSLKLQEVEDGVGGNQLDGS